MVHLKLTTMFIACLVLLHFSNLRGAPPSLESMEPSVGTIGPEFSVLATGSGFERFKNVLFYDEGIELQRHEVISDNELKLWLKSEANASPGRYYFRIVTTDGISELRALTLTPYPLLIEQRETQDAEQTIARDIQHPNITLLGCLEEGDRDRYTAAYTKGERVSVEVEAVRLGYVLLDTIIAVYDPTGKEVARMDDTPLYKQDPFITFVAETSGNYTIEVRETAYEGDNRSKYAIHIGNFIRPSFVFPLGGPIGESTELSIEGDYAGAATISVVPDSRLTEKGLFLSEKENQSPTAIPFRAVPFGNFIEHEPNDTPEVPVVTPDSSSISNLPVAFNGLLERPGDADCFAFRVEAGKIYVFEAYADRLGSLADTFISVVDQEGNILVSNDDGYTHDSRLEFRAPETETYFLRVTDKLANGDWRFVYRVEATERLPIVTSFLPRQIRRSQEGQTVQVPQGNRTLTKFGLQRIFFDGAVDGEFLGLPEGVRTSPITVESDVFWAPVVVSADDDAKIDGQLISATVSTGNDASSTFRGGFSQIVDLVDGPADAIYHQASLDRLAMSVTRRVPFKVDLIPPTTALPLDGSLELKVKVTREYGFVGPIEISLPVLPPDTYAEAEIEIPADQTEAIYTIHSLPETSERTWTLCCEAQASAKARADASGTVERGSMELSTNLSSEGSGEDNNAKETPESESVVELMTGSDLANVKICSELVRLPIAASPIKGTLKQIAGEQGTTIQVLCQVEWDVNRELPEELTITLEDLPNRVAAEPIAWRGEKEIQIPLHLDPTAPLGTFESVYARMHGKINGQNVSFNIGRGTTLTIAPPGKLMRNEKGEALSPLDTLRNRKPK